jgi:tetracycline repressor-like protein
MRYMEALLAGLRTGGFPAGLTYHAYHALDSHIIGFTLWEVGWEVGHTVPDDDVEEVVARFFREFADDHPYLMEHAEQHMAGFGREGQGEFVFVLDLILDCLERARAAAIRRALPIRSRQCRPGSRHLRARRSRRCS